MPLFDGVHVHGVTLSLLLQSAAISQQDCDGLLFGKVQKQFRSEFRDDDAGVVQIEEAHLHITSFLCFSDLGSFYDSTGSVEEGKLSSLRAAARDPVVGWFCSRPSAIWPMQPSMRESAVTASLQRLLDTQPEAWGRIPGDTRPVLLALLSRRRDHHGATLTMSYRVFQHLNPSKQRGKLLVVPTELHTLSLQRHPGAATTAPAAQLAAHAVMTNHAAAEASGVGRPQQQGPGAGVTGGSYSEASAASQVLAATAAASVQQVLQLEEFHKSQLRALQEVCQLVSHQSSQLLSLQLEGEQLAQQLAADSQTVVSS